MAGFYRLMLVAAAAAAFGAPARAEEPGFAEAQYRQRVAQIYSRPPADVDTGDQPSYQRVQQDQGGLLVRIDRLENQLRSMNGQIEQLQFQNRRLEEQLRKFQQDVDFRFQEGAGKSAPRHTPSPSTTPPRERRSDLEPEVAPTTVSGLSSAPGIAVNPPPAPTVTNGGRRSDAFDPNANPHAPGAPRQIGTTTASAPLSSPPRGAVDLNAAPGQPLDLSKNSANGWQPPAPAVIAAPAEAQTAAVSTVAHTPNVAQSGARLDYDLAIGHYRAGQYEAAEKAFGDFISRNPKDKLASDAIFFLGESYFQRNRHREAAEQYLKISTNYGRSAKAPEAMLRLGQSLSALGAKEQACASFGELPRKYPNASTNVRAAADREAKRAACI